jgi:hypothetical protein
MRFLWQFLILLASTQVAPAAIVYDMLYRVGEFESFDGELQVAPASLIGGVEIVLRETVTAGEDSPLEDGLRTFYIDLLATAPDSIIDPTPTDAFIPAGTAADLENPMSAFVAFGSAPASRVDTETVEVVLGTADLVGPQMGSTTFSLVDAEPDEPNMVLANDDPVDSLITYRSLTLTAIPEPSSVVLLGGLGIAGLCVRRRRS